MEPQLEVTGIQRGCVHDGPGVRTVVFLRGCPFSCPWCCNPETLNGSPLYFVDNEKCIRQKGIDSSLCAGCERLGGGRPIVSCPFGVAYPVIKSYDSGSLYDEIVRDLPLFKESGGGVTFSGGEPLVHIKGLLPLLARLKKASIDICFETTLYSKDFSSIKESLSYIDTFIIDLKLHRENTKTDYASTVSYNLDLLRENGNKMIFRLVYHRFMEMENNIIKCIRLLNINELEILKCHSLSESKYRKLGLKFTDYTPDDSMLSEFDRKLRSLNVHTKILRI